MTGEDKSSFSARPRSDCSGKLKESPIKASEPPPPPPLLPQDDGGYATSPSLSRHICVHFWFFCMGKINGLFSFRKCAAVRRTSVWNPQRLGALVPREEGYTCHESAFMAPLATTSSEIFIFLCPTQLPPFYLCSAY